MRPSIGERSSTHKDFHLVPKASRSDGFMDELRDKLTERSVSIQLKRCTHVFIYNTPLTLEFMCDWFNRDIIGPNLECVTFVNCTVYEYTLLERFFKEEPQSRQFPKLKVVEIIN